MADFNSFLQVSVYIDKAKEKLANKIMPLTMDEIGRLIQSAVRNKHGVKQPGRPEGSNPTPLLKTGDLRAAVAYKVLRKDLVSIYTNKERLALIHEYGVTYRMTEKQRKFLFSQVFNKDTGGAYKGSGGAKGFITIPARPIRRVVLDEQKTNIENIVSKNLESVFI